MSNSNSHPDYDNFEVDLSSPFDSQKKSKKGRGDGARERSERTEYGNVDLATGFPSHLIWTAKDGRRIPIPQMEDSHLVNTINYLQRRVDQHRRALALSFIMKATAHSMMFDHILNSDEVAINSQVQKQLNTIENLPQHELADKIFPQYKHLYQEAYKRKLVV